MTLGKKGALARLYDVSVNFPQDAAFGFYQWPESPVVRYKETTAVSVSGILMFLCATPIVPSFPGFLLAGLSAVALSSSWARAGRETRHSLNNGPV